MTLVPSPTGPLAIGELLDALDRGEVGASYRPVAHLATGSSVGWEAIARWDHPYRGVLRPASFLPLAHQRGVAQQVEAAVVDAALGALAAIDDPMRSRPTMSVPVSPATLRSGGAAHWIGALLERHGLAPSRLFVEVGSDTSDATGESPDGRAGEAAEGALRRALEELRALGVRVTLTDVACRDSFQRLRSLPADRLHLGTCCTAALDRPQEQAIVRSLLGLARDLSVDVVADGVETDQHDRLLRRLGCPLGSGPRIGAFVPHLANPSHHDVPPPGRRSFPVPANEVARLAMLYESGMLDSERESVFDAIATDAATACEAPIALVTLVDVDRVFFKATHGMDGAREADRRAAFCAHTICEPSPLVVPDALADERFRDLPAVTDAPYLRFYAGVPLVSSDGVTFGTVCVFDHRARELHDQQLDHLRRLASHASAHVELRARRHQLDRATQSVAAAERAVDELRRLVTLAPVAGHAERVPLSGDASWSPRT